MLAGQGVFALLAPAQLECFCDYPLLSHDGDCTAWRPLSDVGDLWQAFLAAWAHGGTACTQAQEQQLLGGHLGSGSAQAMQSSVPAMPPSWQSNR